MHRKQAIELFRLDQVIGGHGELGSHGRGFETSENEEEKSAEDVEDAEPFVVDSRDPFVHMVQPTALDSFIERRNAQSLTGCHIRSSFLGSLERHQVVGDETNFGLAEFHGWHSRTRFEVIGVGDPRD